MEFLQRALGGLLRGVFTPAHEAGDGGEGALLEIAQEYDASIALVEFMHRGIKDGCQGAALGDGHRRPGSGTFRVFHGVKGLAVTSTPFGANHLQGGEVRGGVEPAQDIGVAEERARLPGEGGEDLLGDILRAVVVAG